MNGVCTHTRVVYKNIYTVPIYNSCTRCVGSPEYTTARPIATQFTGNRCMDDIINWTQLWFASYMGHWCAWLIFWHWHWHASCRLVLELNVSTVYSYRVHSLLNHHMHLLLFVNKQGTCYLNIHTNITTVFWICSFMPWVILSSSVTFPLFLGTRTNDIWQRHIFCNSLLFRNIKG